MRVENESDGWGVETDGGDEINAGNEGKKIYDQYRWQQQQHLSLEVSQ